MKRTALTPEHEEWLIEAAKADLEAFVQPACRQTRLYRAYLPRVYRYFFFRVSDHPTAEDLTSAVFEKVLTELESYQPERGPFGAWLFAIVRHAWADEHRRLRARGEPISLEETEEVPSDQRGRDELFLRQEWRRRLDAAIATLPPREQEIIALKFGNGLTNREIAPILGLSETNVGTIVYRAVRKIRDRIKEENA